MHGTSLNMRALLTSEFLQGIMLSTHDLHNLDRNPQPFHISTLQTEVVKIEHIKLLTQLFYIFPYVLKQAKNGLQS